MASEINGYSVLGKIAKGGMGEVFKAVHKGLGKEVILKKLISKAPPSFYERFKREASIMMDISHPNIVHMYDYFKESGSSYIAMEYVPGYNLSELVKKIGKFPVYLAAFVALEIAKGLEYAHSKGVIHRDIKPGNVLLSTNGDIKLTDFGIAFKTDSHTDENMTKTGTVLGTPAYMSPEQIKSSKDVDVRSDLYSLGILFYEMLTSKRPYANEFNIENLQAISKGKHTSIHKYNNNVPDELIRIIKKMMNSDIKKRYKLSTEFIDDIQKFIKKKFKSHNEIRDILATIINDSYTDEQLITLHYPIRGFIYSYLRKVILYISIFSFLFIFIRVFFPELLFTLYDKDSYGLIELKSVFPVNVKKSSMTVSLINNDKKTRNIILRPFFNIRDITKTGEYTLRYSIYNTEYNKKITVQSFRVKNKNSFICSLNQPLAQNVRVFFNVYSAKDNRNVSNYRLYYRETGSNNWTYFNDGSLYNNVSYDFYVQSNGFAQSFFNNVDTSVWHNNFIYNFYLNEVAAKVTIQPYTIPLEYTINGKKFWFSTPDMSTTSNLSSKKLLDIYLTNGTYNIEAFNKKHSIKLKKEIKISGSKPLSIRVVEDNERNLYLVVK